jgi:hypothetical protein
MSIVEPKSGELSASCALRVLDDEEDDEEDDEMARANEGRQYFFQERRSLDLLTRRIWWVVGLVESNNT